MSKRLDSITRTGTPTGTTTAAKPALKFKPKVVSRKTKEERESSASLNTPGINRLAERNKQRLTKKPLAGGKNKKVSGTLVISGPLSEGTISMGGSSSSSSVNNRGATNPLLEKLKATSERKAKLKKEEGGSGKDGMYGDDSDSDLEDNAIDMGTRSILDRKEEDTDMEQLDTDLFPVRAARNEHREYGEEAKTDKMIKTEFHNASSVIPSASATREGTSVSEPTSRSATPAASGSGSGSTLDNNSEDALQMNDYQANLEAKQFEKDCEELAKSLKSVGVAENLAGNLFFLQLPCSLPVLEGGISGAVGKIRVHKSGKMTMKIGKVKFEVTRGGSTDFVQDLVLVDAENQRCYHIGNVKDKITAIPHII